MNGRLMFGALLVMFGVLLTLDTLGIMEAGEVLRWWPAPLAVYGLMRITGLGARRHVTSGVIFSLIGSWLLLNNLDVVNQGPWDLWPIIIIVIGVAMVTGAVHRRRGCMSVAGDTSSSNFSAFAILSGTERKVTSADFRGGDITAILGGHEIDLSSAKMTGGSAVIDLFVWWGGVTLRVPPDWHVSPEARSEERRVGKEW